MRSLVLVLALLAACSGPIAPTHVQTADEQGPKIFRPPPNAPPDPIGTERPNGARSCNIDSDCKAGERCFAPDFSPGGGAAPQCQSDAQCTDGQVCLGKTCGPKCKPDSCGTGMRCAESGHCEQMKCTEPNAPICSLNFRCNTTSGACERTTCTASSQCDQGLCWNGTCYAHAGYCMPQSYCCPP